MKLILFLCLLAGCGGMGSAPFMAPAETCSSEGLTVQVETGSGNTTCAQHLQVLSAYRAIYIERWGTIPAITVRMRATKDLRTTGVSESFSVQGKTYEDGVIDLARAGWMSLPHEINHVVHGVGHVGWCSPFMPWQRDAIGLDEHAYLCGGN